MNYTITSAAQLRLLGQAYGTDAYGSNTYACAAGQTTCNTSPLAPLTGFFRDQPPTVVIPVLLVVAVLIAAVSLLVTKLVRKRRHQA
jgi:hypothetical protein